MSRAPVSRRDLLSLLGLARPEVQRERIARDAASGTVRPGAVFSLEEFYARRRARSEAGAPDPEEQPGT